MSITFPETNVGFQSSPLAWRWGWAFRDRRQVKLAVRFFLVIAGLFFVLWSISLYFNALIDNKKHRAAVSEMTVHARSLMGETIKTYVADLEVIAQGQNLSRLASGDEAARAAVRYDFEIFVAAKPAVAQLRFFDRQGNEIVRVDRRGGKIVDVPHGRLQNKSDRYYFERSAGLPPGGLYVSPIDLNIENGKIEVPWRPMIRLAMPIATGGRSNAGVVVVNIAADYIIGKISETPRTGISPLQLLNEEGYWLAGVPSDQLWGFMFGRHTTMAESAPEAWRRIAEQDQGDFSYAGERYNFQTLRPSPYISSNMNGEIFDGGDTEWKIVGVVPEITVASLFRIDQAPFVAVFLAIIGIVSMAWSGAVIGRRDAENRKRKTDEELMRIERLASLGGLVAGVAHELNTPIGNAVTVASTLDEHIKGLGAEIETGRIRKSALEARLRDLNDGTAIILRALDRASNLIRHFKQVAVDQTSEQRRVFRISDLIEDVTGTVRSRFKHGGVQLETVIETTAELDSYPGPLGQVLINLIENARIHGFDDGDGGAVEIRVRKFSEDELEIVVRDTGKGVPPDNLEKIFEPFFTTRLGEGGSGLGLSIVFNIVTNGLGGKVRADSAPGEGTAVILRIPVSAPRGKMELMEEVYNVT